MSFLNIFIDYSLGEMQTIDMKWKHWNIAPFRLWQTQLNIVMFCTSSTCGVSFKYLNYRKHSMVRSLYQFHMYYHLRQVLKRLQVLLPYKLGSNATNNPYSSEGFFKLCEDYGVSHDPMRYWNKKFFGTHKHKGLVRLHNL